MKRKNWGSNEHTWLCSTYFISGGKSSDILSPDYIPSLFSFTNSCKAQQQLEDYERRKMEIMLHSVASTIITQYFIVVVNWHCTTVCTFFYIKRMGWPCVSDKFEFCGILDHLLTENQGLAKSGFTMKDVVALLLNYKIPSFT